MRRQSGNLIGSFALLFSATAVLLCMLATPASADHLHYVPIVDPRWCDGSCNLSVVEPDHESIPDTWIIQSGDVDPSKISSNGPEVQFFRDGGVVQITKAIFDRAAFADALSIGLINSWILALRYIGDGPHGQGFDGPGNIAFDKDGNAWINNNYAFTASSDDAACGSTRLLKLTPTGRDAPGAPFGGQPDDGDG